jgi:hypothetical protein
MAQAGIVKINIENMVEILRQTVIEATLDQWTNNLTIKLTIKSSKH